MSAIELQIFDAALKARLARMIAANNDPSKLTAAWANDLLNSVEDVFAAEGKPRWAALSKVTLERRRKGAGSAKDKILQDSGLLAGSIQHGMRSGTDFALLSTDKVYATTMHYGAKQGQFGRSRLANKHGPSKGGPLPWGNIPARPFMVLLPEYRAQIVARGLQWVSGNGL